ncbi:MAG: segregation/condensation protein A [Actinomycetota bacterium]|nr:segregation/condensation protein A [Actinomycetota bacterium]|tara:strand:+ start:4145 stop:4918 length:774 start_codon:yes stop_codon:yes gene_type:complete
MAVTVTTPVYEGPFDLLLDLILREEVELYEVSLLTIVDAYLEELENMKEYDLELATEFLLIAAILVELKARRLLPSGNKIDPDDEFGLWEERDLLLAKLVECKTFKEAASQLRELSQQASLSWPRRAGLEEAFLSLTPDLLEGVTKEDLREACLRAMAPRPSISVNTEHIAPIKATVVEAVRELIEEMPRTGSVSFKELTKGLTDRIEIVVRFLAILELYKQGVLEIDQIDSFGEINVSWCSDTEIADMDLLDIYEG